MSLHIKLKNVSRLLNCISIPKHNSHSDVLSNTIVMLLVCTPATHFIKLAYQLLLKLISLTGLIILCGKTGFA